jgi:hypothetical protein
VSALSYKLDGVDVTEIVQLGRWRPRFSTVHSGVIQYPADLLTITPGISELQILLDADLVYSGLCWYTQLNGDPDATNGEISSWDWSIWLRKRMCRQGLTDPEPGSMVDVSPVIAGGVTATEIAAAFVQNAIDIDPGGAPFSVGTVDTGGEDVSSVPMSFPMTIDRMINLLLTTGQLVVRREATAGGTILHFLNPYENDLSATVSFEYATGAFNAQVATYTIDLDEVVNALWYLLGRRRPDGRWPGSITATAPHVGGSWPAALLTRIADSRSDFTFAQEIQILDDAGDENEIREMFEERWANEAWVRAMPRQFATVKPDRGTAPAFEVGDLIGVAAGSALGGGFSGTERVYGFDLSCDVDGILAFDDILTSADQEGAEAVPED